MRPKLLRFSFANVIQGGPNYVQGVKSICFMGITPMNVIHVFPYIGEV